MKTTRTKIYGDWGQLQGIMVWNYNVKQNMWGEWNQWELINNYFVKNDNYIKEIV